MASPNGDENLASVNPTLAEVIGMDPGIMGSKTVNSNIDVTLKTDVLVDESDMGLKEEITIAVPDLEGDGFGSATLLDRESELLASFKVASLDEERFLKQKSKGKAVPKAFVDHYTGFLGKEEAVMIPITLELFDVRIDQAMSVDMI
ncbi:hypothetical protein QVD17_19777 [Tagetes erecta]|uniref:Uncharacterized protein n=1 Tax=Tagetes erecta TaxID=13708 RepID=A0AAD8KK74_TARER|nr:hypothetical protein QVD17_19777 [Tagetes erecta]